MKTFNTDYFKTNKKRNCKFSRPNPKRDYIHVNDIADAVVCAVNKNLNGLKSLILEQVFPTLLMNWLIS